MANFTYTAKYQTGQTVSGTVEANTLSDAQQLLQDRQLIVIAVKEQPQSILVNTIKSWLAHVSVKEIAFFARQFAVLINASIPVVRALKTLTKQIDNPTFKLAVADIAAAVEGGAKLSVAMARYPKIFDQFFVNMIKAGETTGRLDKVLEYLAEQKEKDYSLKSRIRGAMIYPIVIISAMVVIGAIMMIYVVPKLAEVITQSGSELPWTTKILLSTSYILAHYWWLILFLLALIIVAVAAFARTDQGAYYLDQWKLKIPVLGKLYQQIALTRFAISLSSLLSSGVPVTKSLEISADVVDNLVYQTLIRKAVKEVEGGNSIATVFMHDKNIPVIMPQMMTVGEETGRLDEVLNKLAQFYTREVDGMLATLTSLIEPVVIIALGIGAGIMVTGILMPIYTASSNMQ
ncbi:MAG: type II secretion system F family protein [Patescibacteria group bacterium]|jgi:type IV pilus assembly protein PilC